MASFGGQSCTFIRGDANNPKARVDTWQIRGIAGYGAELLANGDAPGSFVLVLHDSAANVATWFGVIEAKQGSVVVVVNDWGTTYSNFLVTKVDRPTRTAKYGGCRGELIVHGVITA